MEKKITIFGDSYADPKGKPAHTWHKRFDNVKNYGESGTGSQYSFNIFYDLNFTEEDVIIFLLSDAFRINFHGGNLIVGELSNIKWFEETRKTYCVFEHLSENQLTKRHLKILDFYEKNKSEIDFLYLTFEKELAKTNEKNIAYLHSYSLKHKCKIIAFEIFETNRDDMSHLNCETFHLYNGFLRNDSMGEIFRDEIDKYVKFTDKRHNHFSDENHDIFYQYIQNVLNDKPLPKFKQNFKHFPDVYYTAHLTTNESTDFIYE